jgi:hypothetical protein
MSVRIHGRLFASVAPSVAPKRRVARPVRSPPTVRFSGRTYPQVAMRSASVRVCCRPLPFAVAWCWCCYGCCQGTDGLTRRPPPMPGLGTIRHRAGLRVQVSRAWDGPYPGQARCLALGFWPECFRRLNVKGGRRSFPEETRSALDIEGKHVTIQGPSPDLSLAMPFAPSTGCQDLLIRRLRQVVQDRLLPSVRWADIPQLSAPDRRCPAAWQQYWQQLRRNGFDPRPV